jgi:hypothetical protein
MLRSQVSLGDRSTTELYNEPVLSTAAQNPARHNEIPTVAV